MNIRELQLNDYEQYLELIREFRPTFFTKEQFEYILQASSTYSKIFVLEDNNKLIATATIIYETKFIFNISKLAHIEDVCVHSNYRKAGYGKKIVQHCIENAKKEGAYKITLDCNSENIPFYTACGFEKRGTQMTILLKEPM